MSDDADLLVLRGVDGVSLEIGLLAGGAPGLTVRVRTGSCDAVADDEFETAALAELWSRLEGGADDECHLHGASGRIELILRWTESAAGVRLSMRPATGLRLELETEVVSEPAVWRAVVAGWLREGTEPDAELPWL